eukprot:5602478-Amphidinium_carterae.1
MKAAPALFSSKHLKDAKELGVHHSKSCSLCALKANDPLFLDGTKCALARPPPVRSSARMERGEDNGPKGFSTPWSESDVLTVRPAICRFGL